MPRGVRGVAEGCVSGAARELPRPGEGRGVLVRAGERCALLSASFIPVGRVDALGMQPLRAGVYGAYYSIYFCELLIASFGKFVYISNFYVFAKYFLKRLYLNPSLL